MVKASGYQRFETEALTLRDELALERTLLANERTLLAYLRTAMALLLVGATMIHFAHQGWFLAVGVACLPAGLIGGTVGLVRFFRLRQSIEWMLHRRQAQRLQAGRADPA